MRVKEWVPFVMYHIIEARYQSRTTATEKSKVIDFFKISTVWLDLSGVGPTMN